MALVMLPCDLPWWPMLQRHLKHLTTDDCDHISALQSIHNLCNVGLDPDERDSPDLTVFAMLETFLAEVSDAERRHVLGTTVPAMARRALRLRDLRPPGGLHFSLQQQQDRIEFDREFIASLLAHLFFSTFPKRTPKTHPTLQDFNFTNFFKHLDQNFQKAKLRSFFHYFDLLEENGVPSTKIIFSRQVMSGKEWLTIEDWLECGLALCPLVIRHEGRLDRAPPDHLVVCFTSSRVGGQVLGSGSSWECLQLFQCPEILSALLFCEALEDNEVVTMEGVMQVSRITDPRYKATLELLDTPPTLSSLLMDAENYAKLPLSQYEEDNFLRELNKSLLGFRQRYTPPPPPTARRLSPIGESFSSTPPETEEASSKAAPPPPPAQKPRPELGPLPPITTRRRFILLGSSGECLPVSRNPASRYSSCYSSDDGDQYFSARTSISETLEEEEEDGEGERNYSAQLDTPERRCTFAQRLREALDRAQSSESSESSYAVGISVTGSSTADKDIRMKRGGSRGFMLEEDSVDDRGRSRRMETREPHRPYKRGNSSRYSFSTEYSSDLEDVYEQLGRWLEEAGDSADGECDRQRLRDMAVVQFAGSLLKRTLSESFVGVPLDTGSADHVATEDSETRQRVRLASAARSLSLELARHKHKLAAQLVSLVGQKRDCERSLLPVATGNWGCGSSCLGEPQLKVLTQWLTASVAGVPHLLYFTCCHYKLLKLDTVCRVLLDRQWSVGELTGAILRYLQATLDNPNPADNNTLFEFLIGAEERQPHDSPPSDTSP